MPDNNKLELVVEVDVNKANASIKSINTGLSNMEQAAGKAARSASAGIDGLTVTMVKGSAASRTRSKRRWTGPRRGRSVRRSMPPTPTR